MMNVWAVKRIYPFTQDLTASQDGNFAERSGSDFKRSTREDRYQNIFKGAMK